MPGYMGYTASHNKDGSVTFGYTPVLPGTYKITVQYNGEIPEGGELSCLIEEAEGGFITAYGLGNMIDSDTVHAGAEVTVHRPEPPSLDAEDDLQSPTIAQEQDDEKEMQETRMDISSVAGFNTQEGPAISMADQESALLSITGQDQGEGAMEVPDDDQDLAGFNDADDNASQAQVIGGDVTNIKQELLEGVNRKSSSTDDLEGRQNRAQPLSSEKFHATMVKSEDRALKTAENTSVSLETILDTIDKLPDKAPDNMIIEMPQILDNSVNADSNSLTPTTVAHMTRSHSKKAKVEAVNEKKRVSKRKRKPKGGKVAQSVEPTDEAGYSCEECGKTLKSKVTLMNHMVLHSGGKQMCDICGKTFNNKSTLNQHLNTHNKDSDQSSVIVKEEMDQVVSVDDKGNLSAIQDKWKYKCPNLGCKKKFRFESSFVNHLKRMHGFAEEETENILKGEDLHVIESSLVNCPSCGIICLDEEKLTRHSKIHSEKRPYNCSKCPMAFRLKSVLNNHMAVHGEGKMACVVCNKSFSSKPKLDRHVETHSKLGPSFTIYQGNTEENKPDLNNSSDVMKIDPDQNQWKKKKPVAQSFFNCEEPGCTEKFKSKSMLCTHINHHHNHNPKALGSNSAYVCDTCGKLFANKFKLERHHTSHTDTKTFMCEMCGSWFKTRDGLVVHRKEMHPFDSMEIDSQHVYKPYVCPECGKAFKRKIRLNQHIAEHKSTEQFQCPRCSKTFPTVHKMREHLRTVHPAVEHRIVCPYEGCNKILKGYKVYSAHAKIHENMRWDCMDSNCTREFATRHSMLQHYENYHKNSESAYVCDVEGCNKKFRIKGSLKQHMITHKTERNFVCGECDKAFKTMYALRLHARIHDKSAQLQCMYCPKTFTRNAKLQEHILSHEQVYEVAQEQVYVTNEQAFAVDGNETYSVITLSHGDIAEFKTEVQT